VLTAYPRLRIVLAHTGHPSTATALELLERHENLYSDMTPVGARPNAIATADLERFAGRILFGSDAPNNATPPAEQAARWATVGLSEHALAMLMGGAAATLIGD
jgi:predicted TIM-barrel fold metal-dependent hydrolase